MFITGYVRASLERRYSRVPILQMPIEADALDKVLVTDFAAARLAQRRGSTTLPYLFEPHGA